MDTSKNFSFLVLKSIADLVGGHVQFISDEQCLIVDNEGGEMAKFLGMTTVIVEGKKLERALLHSAVQIAVFINNRGEK